MMRPNVLLVTVECWRADHFGTLTPNLESLGNESIVFRDSHVLGGWTLPSLTAFMSSAYASMWGGPRVALATPERTTLAECFLKAGYWTAAITANPVCGTINGFHRGFGRFRLLSKKIPPRLLQMREELNDPERLAESDLGPQDVEWFSDAREVTDSAVEWLGSSHRKNPYFLWLHYLDPHWPYLTADRPKSREELRDQWIDRQLLVSKLNPTQGRFDLGGAGAKWFARYRKSVETTDRELGRLLAYLKERDDWGNTAVLVTGDHGEEFYEHGTWLHQWNQLHREGVHVPTILRIPGGEHCRVTPPVSHLDVAPTLLDYAGLAKPQAMLGKSLRGMIEQGEASERPVFTEMMSHRNSVSYSVAIRHGDWKYIQDFDRRHGAELFNVAQDPGETRNVIDAEAVIRRRFEQLKLEHLGRGAIDLMKKCGSAQQEQTADAAVQEQLAALGYI